METLFKNTITGLHYWQIKLQTNTVIEKSGQVGSVCDYKLTSFDDANSAQSFYTNQVSEMGTAFCYIPWKDEIMIGVRVNKNHEPKFDLSLYWDEVQEVIVYLQEEPANIEIKDVELLESVYWIKILVVEKDLALLAIRKYLLKHGAAEVMLVS